MVFRFVFSVSQSVMKIFDHWAMVYPVAKDGADDSPVHILFVVFFRQFTVTVDSL